MAKSVRRQPKNIDVSAGWNVGRGRRVHVRAVDVLSPDGAAYTVKIWAYEDQGGAGYGLKTNRPTGGNVWWILANPTPLSALVSEQRLRTNLGSGSGDFTLYVEALAESPDTTTVLDVTVTPAEPERGSFFTISEGGKAIAKLHFWVA